MKLLWVVSLVTTLLCFSGSVLAKEWSTPEALRAFGKPGDTVSDSANVEANKPSSSHNKREKTDYSKMSDDELRAIAPKRPTVDYSKMSDEELLAAAPKRRVVDYSKMSDEELLSINNHEPTTPTQPNSTSSTKNLVPFYGTVVASPPSQSSSNWLDKGANRTLILVVIIGATIGLCFVNYKAKKNNSARKTKGIKWAFIVFMSLLAPLVMRILFASGHADPQERIIAGLAGFIGMMIIACPIAYAIGYFTVKAE